MRLPHDEKELEQIYKSRFSGKTDYRVRVWKILAGFFRQWIPKDAIVLDLGAGYCEFINSVVNAQVRYAMDLNPEIHNRALPGVTTLQQDCSEQWPLAEAELDIVFTSNFLEHLPDKAAVRDTLGQAYRCLKPGGRMICLGPNIKYVPGAYWDFFDHYVELTELSLAEVMAQCGFSVEEQIGRFLPYTMSHGPRRPTWMLRLYLKVPLMWPLFGKQFLVVGRKPI